MVPRPSPEAGYDTAVIYPGDRELPDGYPGREPLEERERRIGASWWKSCLVGGAEAVTLIVAIIFLLAFFNSCMRTTFG